MVDVGDAVPPVTLVSSGVPAPVQAEAATAAGLGEEGQLGPGRAATLSRAGSVAQSNKEVQKVRVSSQHQGCRVQDKTLACPMGSRLWQAVQHMVAAMRKSFGDWQSRCKTPNNTLHLHLSWPLGVGNLKIVEDIFPSLRGAPRTSTILALHPLHPHWGLPYRHRRRRTPWLP